MTLLEQKRQGKGLPLGVPKAADDVAQGQQPAVDGDGLFEPRPSGPCLLRPLSLRPLPKHLRTNDQ